MDSHSTESGRTTIKVPWVLTLLAKAALVAVALTALTYGVTRYVLAWTGVS